MLFGLGFVGENWGWGRAKDLERKLVILHTNDTHPTLSLSGSTGSFSRAANLLIARNEKIQQIRAEGNPVLLLDAGDFTGRYPNLLPNELPPAWRAMQLMGYDAVALGDGELAAGIELIALHWEKVGIPLLACNYKLEGTPLEKWVMPHCILEKGSVRIGMIGVGLPLSNRLPEMISSRIECKDPVQSVNASVLELQRQGCELIICLSHLGDQAATEKLNDFHLAQENLGIDIIIGAHSHRLYEQPRKFTNKMGGITLVNQLGWGGGYLGRVDCFFPKKGPTKTLKANRLNLEKKIAK